MSEALQILQSNTYNFYHTLPRTLSMLAVSLPQAPHHTEVNPGDHWQQAVLCKPREPKDRNSILTWVSGRRGRLGEAPFGKSSPSGRLQKLGPASLGGAAVRTGRQGQTAGGLQGCRAAPREG